MYTGGLTIWLADRSIVLALQVAESRRGTINYSTWELHDDRTARRSEVSQVLQQHKGSCAVVWVGWKVTVIVTIHDVMLVLRPNGVGSKHSRWTLWGRFLKISSQLSINGQNVGGTIEFKFKRLYKLQRVVQLTTHGNLRTELLPHRHSWTQTCSIFWRHWETCGITLWQHLKKPWIPK